MHANVQTRFNPATGCEAPYYHQKGMWSGRIKDLEGMEKGSGVYFLRDQCSDAWREDYLGLLQSDSRNRGDESADKAWPQPAPNISSERQPQRRPPLFRAVGILDSEHDKHGPEAEWQERLLDAEACDDPCRERLGRGGGIAPVQPPVEAGAGDIPPARLEARPRSRKWKYAGRSVLRTKSETPVTARNTSILRVKVGTRPLYELINKTKLYLGVALTKSGV